MAAYEGAPPYLSRLGQVDSAVMENMRTKGNDRLMFPGTYAKNGSVAQELVRITRFFQSSP